MARKEGSPSEKDMNQQEFRLDGGSVWLNLASTVGRAYSTAPVERIPTPMALDAWLASLGLPCVPSNSEDLQLVYSLRADCRTLSESLVGNARPDSEVLERLAGIANGMHVTVASGGLRYSSVAEALAIIAATALSFVHSPESALLTQCQDPECAWVFLDPSHRRHWCSAASCGTRTRVRAHRARLNAVTG